LLTGLLCSSGTLDADGSIRHVGALRGYGSLTRSRHARRLRITSSIAARSLSAGL
jgi:hypothetical protein